MHRAIERFRDGRIGPWLAMTGVIAVTVLQLRRQGRLWWCACGRLDPWWGDVWSRHNSQHLFDPYSLTHVLHGLIVYGLLAWICPRMPLRWRLFLGVSLEALFEIVENGSFVIHRYRTATASLGYEGDTIANSLGDILSFSAGFLLARPLGKWGSLAMFVVIEVLLLIWIKDNFVLNVLMLVHPVESVREWQLSH